MGVSTQPWCPPPLDSSPTSHESIPVDISEESNVEDELHRLREQAREAGYSEGHEQGVREGRIETGAAAIALTRLLAKLTEPVTEFNSELEEKVIALAVEIARRVVLHEISVAPERLETVIRECLKHVPLRHGALRLRVNPTDRDALLENAVELPGKGFELCPDPTLSLGGCVLEIAAPTPLGVDRDWATQGDDGSGEVDARIERRWGQVMAGIFDEDLIQ